MVAMKRKAAEQHGPSQKNTKKIPGDLKKSRASATSVTGKDGKAKKKMATSTKASGSKGTSRPSQAPIEPPANKAEKKARVQAKKEAKRPIFGLVKQVLALWEEMRNRDATAATKKELAGKVTVLSKGKLKELSMNHASSRVVQAVLKHGGTAERAAVWGECKEGVVEMSMSPHGNYVIRKLITAASKAELAGMARACKGHVVKLFRHPCASAVIGDLYSELPPAERNALISEFYGREFALLGSAQSAAGRLGCLVDTWPGLEGTKRRTIMKHLILSLQPIIEKAYVDPPAIHRLVSEYMLLAPGDMLQDTVAVLCGEAVLRMVHTHAGSRVGCMVAAYSTPKERKKLVKAMKGHVCKMALDEFAYVALIKLLSVVDDTQLLRKTIAAELVEGIEEVASSAHGIKVLMSLLQPETKHLPPHAVALLDTPERRIKEVIQPAEEKSACVASATDEGKAGKDGENLSTGGEQPTREVVMGVSKKDAAVRRCEIVSAGKASLGRSLLQSCCANVDSLMRQAHGAGVLGELCCGGAVGAALWAGDEAVVRELHDAVVAAIAAGSGQDTMDWEEQGQIVEAEVGEGRSKKKGKGACRVRDSAATVGPAAAPREALLENLFASRTLRRMVRGGDGCCAAASEAFVQALWGGAVKGRCADIVGGHGAKVVAGMLEGAGQVVRKELEGELASCVGDVSTWSDKFLHSKPKVAPTKKKGSC